MEQHRQELSNAEKLFDLPITNYPGILEVDRDIRNISKVYELYAAQKVSKTSQLDFIAADELEFLISQPCFEPKKCSQSYHAVSHCFIIKVAREEWASTLWANLDIVKLTSGIDEFMRRLRKLPKEVKALAICNVLEEKMREFKDSIPLFADLKNDALRDR